MLQISLSLESYFALFAVGGIVINDSLILIAQTNQYLQQRVSVIDVTILAGKSRFRTIFLTTLTTFGVLFAFFVTLFLMPVSYVVFL